VLTAEALKEQWQGMLAHSQSMWLNTIIFQVSPSLDAFYASEHRPWSSYLTNKAQGTPPEWAADFDLIVCALLVVGLGGVSGFNRWGFLPYSP